MLTRRSIKIEISRFTILPMVKILEMDETITLEKQLEEDIGPVILINKFNLDPQDVNQFLKAWASDAENHETATWIHLNPTTSRYCWK